MRAGPNSDDRHTLDVFFNGRKLANPFWFDEEAGEVWVCPYVFDSNDKGVLSKFYAPPGTYLHEGCYVILLVGVVKATITPYGPWTEEEIKQRIQNSDSSMNLQRLTLTEPVSIIWPDDREKESTRA